MFARCSVLCTDSKRDRIKAPAVLPHSERTGETHAVVCLPLSSRYDLR